MDNIITKKGEKGLNKTILKTVLNFIPFSQVKKRKTNKSWILLSKFVVDMDLGILILK